MKLEGLKEGKDLSTDIYCVSGFGRFKHEGKKEKSQSVGLDIKFLEKIVKLCKQMEWNRVWLRVQEDFPVFFTKEKKDTIGFVLAPKIKED